MNAAANIKIEAPFKVFREIITTENFDLGKPGFHEFHFYMNIFFSEKYL